MRFIGCSYGIVQSRMLILFFKIDITHGDTINTDAFISGFLYQKPNGIKNFYLEFKYLNNFIRSSSFVQLMDSFLQKFSISGWINCNDLIACLFLSS